jgi:hypothetical protein
MTSNHITIDRQQRINRALEQISHISFEGVRLKLGDAAEGKGWDKNQLHDVEKEYRRFLALLFAYPERTIVPDKKVDQFWHQHILDTRAYANDTTAVFGQFLHHFPYLGMRGPADEERLKESFQETRRLYQLHFGESGLQGSYSVCSDSCSRCTT